MNARNPLVKFPQIEDGASFSNNGMYRDDLIRVLDPSNPRICNFIMLNPSTASARKDDPTVRRGKGFATALGMGVLVVTNLYAFCATDPDDMRRAIDPIGPNNHEAVTRWAHRAVQSGGKVICAWGVQLPVTPHEAIVCNHWLEGVPLHCLRLTKDGFPSHPLYLPKSLRPIPFKVRTA